MAEPRLLFHCGKEGEAERQDTITCPWGGRLPASALCSGVRAPNPGGEGQHCFLDMTARSALSIVCLAGPATTSLLLFIVCLMSTSDDSLCRQKSVFVVSSQLSFLLSPRTRQDRCPLPTGAPGAGTNALTTSCRPVRGWLTLRTEGLRSEEESQDGQPRASPPSLTKAAHISAQGGGSDHLQTRGVTRGSPEVSTLDGQGGNELPRNPNPQGLTQGCRGQRVMWGLARDRNRHRGLWGCVVPEPPNPLPVHILGCQTGHDSLSFM